MIQLFNSHFYFHFSFNNVSSLLIVSFQSDQKQQHFIELKLELPNKQSVDEIVCRLGNNDPSGCLFHSLITYSEVNGQLFKHHLTKFLSEQNQLFYDQLTRQAVHQLDKNKIKSYWFKVFASNQRSSSSPTLSSATTTGMSASPSSDSQSIQAKDYHKLMHSNLMPIILEREKEYAVQLNKLAAAAASSDPTAGLDRIEKLKREQKSKFQHFIKKLYQYNEENNGNSSGGSSLEALLASLNTDLSTDLLDLDDLDYIKADRAQASTASKQTQHVKHLSNLNSFTRLEESYTIQLGAQLKTTHNLRLIRSNIYDFCSDRFTPQHEIEPQAIQTALSLYSNKLCALLILLDSKESRADDELNNICDRNGCDFHFDSISEQKKLAFNHKQPLLNVGDFFVTKHSNLSQVHVIFHLQSYDPKQEKQSDLSSRHPVILGLRNVLKTCVLNDIQTLTFPLLLTHEMSEEMTISWVMKRAELVLKCIKGFMIEFVNWGAQESRTLQFVVPQGLMDETFDSLRTLIPTIFRESRTVNLV